MLFYMDSFPFAAFPFDFTWLWIKDLQSNWVAKNVKGPHKRPHPLARFAQSRHSQRQCQRGGWVMRGGQKGPSVLATLYGQRTFPGIDQWHSLSCLGANKLNLNRRRQGH